MWLSGGLTEGPLDRLTDQVGHPATKRLREALAQALAQIGQILLQTMELFGQKLAGQGRSSWERGHDRIHTFLSGFSRCASRLGKSPPPYQRFLWVELGTRLLWPARETRYREKP